MSFIIQEPRVFNEAGLVGNSGQFFRGEHFRFAARVDQRLATTSEPTYITILASAVGHEPEGFSVDYDWDQRHFATKPEAVSHGFELRKSDDFNIGVVSKGRLVSLWWMDHQVTESTETLAEISREISLSQD